MTVVKEAKIIINGVELHSAHSMAIRVAVSNFLHELADEKHMKDMGPIGPLYQLRLCEVQDLILKSIEDQRR